MQENPQKWRKNCFNKGAKENQQEYITAIYIAVYFKLTKKTYFPKFYYYYHQQGELEEACFTWTRIYHQKSPRKCLDVKIQAKMPRKLTPQLYLLSHLTTSSSRGCCFPMGLTHTIETDENRYSGKKVQRICLQNQTKHKKKTTNKQSLQREVEEIQAALTGHLSSSFGAFSSSFIS